MIFVYLGGYSLLLVLKISTICHIICYSFRNFCDSVLNLKSYMVLFEVNVE